jgi:hypothetical protein
MIASRVVLAMMDAAAIEKLSASPWMIARCRTGISGSLRASIRGASGADARPSMARRMTRSPAR